jgi:N-acetylneuraminate synthase
MSGRSDASSSFAIDGRAIGPNQPPYIIAELSANHRGSIETALDLIEAAARAGAHAVKLQTYTADTMTLDHDGPDFVIQSGPWQGRRLYDLYHEAHTPWDWFPALFAKARACGICCFSSPFDESAVDMLESLNAPAYKIASFEMIDHPLIERAARTGKPLIMSRGMATAEEIAEAVAVARDAGCRDLLLLHCVSGYPTPAEEINLASIPDLARRFSTLVGLSDHTLGTAVAVASVALGAVAVEKHFIRRRTDGGPDAAFSIEPPELADLVDGTLTAWKALGHPSYTRKASEASQVQLRRSLYIAADVKAGEELTSVNLRSIRPGFGLSPKHLREVLGRRAVHDLTRGTPLRWEDLA